MEAAWSYFKAFSAVCLKSAGHNEISKLQRTSGEKLPTKCQEALVHQHKHIKVQRTVELSEHLERA